MSFIYVPFSYLMKGCLWRSQNSYFFALFFFSLAIEIILIPLSIKQQKSQIQQAKVRPKEMAIREKYKGRNDRATQQKMTMEIQTMYQESGYNQFSGCLPLLIQLPVILILFTIVRNPIAYATNIASDYGENFFTDKTKAIVEYYDAEKEYLIKDNFSEEDYNKLIEKIDNAKNNIGTVDENGNVKVAVYNDMYISQFISNAEDDMENLIAEGKLKPEIRDHFAKTDLAKYKEDVPNYKLFSLDLGEVPKDSGIISWLFLFPVLVFLTSFLSTKINRKLQPQQLDANGKPIGGGLFMEVGMPLISAIFSYTFVAAISAYWIWRTVIGIGKSFAFAKAMPIPQVTEEQIAEAKRELKGKQKKKKVITIEVDEDHTSYDDMIVAGGNVKPSGSSDPAKRTARRMEMLTADDDDIKNPKVNDLDSEDK